MGIPPPPLVEPVSTAMLVVVLVGNALIITFFSWLERRDQRKMAEARKQEEARRQRAKRKQEEDERRQQEAQKNLDEAKKRETKKKQEEAYFLEEAKRKPRKQRGEAVRKQKQRRRYILYFFLILFFTLSSLLFISPKSATKKNASPNNVSPGNRKTTQNSPFGSTVASSASGSGSQPPQPNWNNKKHEQCHEDEWLINFLKLLKEILDRCNCPLKLRNRILGFFKNFEKHQDNFKRLLEDITIKGIKEDDLLSIVIKLFMSDAFAKDVTYGNFISLMEFVAKFIKDEAKFELASEDEKGEIQLSFEQQLSKNIQKVVARSDILDTITKLFEETRQEIEDDNAARFLELDFSGIFTKVYHYFKHREVRGKVMTVKEYFDWVRKLIPLVKNLRPEYVELTDPSHERREIKFEMYVTAYQGYIRIVVRVYGTEVKICTVFVREKKDRHAKDGDKYVDGKKRN